MSLKLGDVARLFFKVLLEALSDLFTDPSMAGARNLPYPCCISSILIDVSHLGHDSLTDKPHLPPAPHSHSHLHSHSRPDSQ
jgi:hypothetical protein